MSEEDKFRVVEKDHADIIGGLEDALMHNPRAGRKIDPARWGPSTLCMLPECPRQALNRKLNLEATDVAQQGVFQSGTNHHEWVENDAGEFIDGRISHEYPMMFGYDPDNRELIFDPRKVRNAKLKVSGRADMFDYINQVVFDLKTTGKTPYNYSDNLGDTRYPKNFQEDHKYHRDYVDQVMMYMAGLGVDHGRIVYQHKLDLQNVYYPKDGCVEYNDKRVKLILDSAYAITKMLNKHLDEDGNVDVASVMEDGHPFKKCSRSTCWGCKRYETLKEEYQQNEEESTKQELDDIINGD